MCEIWEEVRREGKAEGRIEGKLEAFKDLMQTTGWTMEKVMVNISQLGNHQFTKGNRKFIRGNRS